MVSFGSSKLKSAFKSKNKEPGMTKDIVILGVGAGLGFLTEELSKGGKMSWARTLAYTAGYFGALEIGYDKFIGK